ncbi:hypothetical protein [Pararhizobium qamdonense]|uniref:hypothetical protein n=1 Tax=Pararhizobium qamdonense TaxID=3031126 RepID=UPI0023E289ED|nr:hypothetical protein [Pararhizobium qamdonense]
MILNIPPFTIDPDDLHMYTTVMGVNYEQLEIAHYSEVLNRLLSTVPEGEPIQVVTIDRRVGDICQRLLGLNKKPKLIDTGRDPLEYFGVEYRLKDGKRIPAPINRRERRKSKSKR